MMDIGKQKRSRIGLLAASSFFAMTLGAQMMHAQITDQIKANIAHRFTVGTATLPPGQYTFRILRGTDMNAMMVTSQDGNTSDEFLVREAKLPDPPKHSELVFDRYGNHEFLAKIFEKGHKTGVAVAEPSREESRLQKQGQQPVEHTEEQQQ